MEVNTGTPELNNSFLAFVPTAPGTVSHVWSKSRNFDGAARKGGAQNVLTQ